MDDGSSQHRGDRRQGLRVDTDLWVRVVGRDGIPRLSHGNISVSGVYFDSSTRLGGPGAVEMLEIHSEDRLVSFRTLACLIRVSQVEDLIHGTLVRGLAFEFLPDDDETHEAITRAVSHMVHAYLDDPNKILGDLRLEATVAEGDPPAGAVDGDRRAQVAAVQGRGIVLEANWPLEAGAIIRMAIETPAQPQPMQLEGVVAHSEVSSTRDHTYRIQIALDEGAGDRRAAAIDSLVDGMSPRPTERVSLANAPHLLGDLSRVPLAQVLALLDSEKLSAHVELKTDAELATLFVRDGRVHGVSRPGLEAPPLVLVEELLMWREGTFKVTVGALEMKDEVGVPTRELLKRFMEEETDAL